MFLHWVYEIFAAVLCPLFHIPASVYVLPRAEANLVKQLFYACDVTDSLFMTGSHDGTLKFWMIPKAGITRKYIPNYDRTEKPVKVMIPCDETVLTLGDHSR